MGWLAAAGCFPREVSHAAVRRHMELESSEGSIKLNVKGVFSIHVPKVSSGMARAARVWLGISLRTASPYGFLSLTASGRWTSYMVAGLLLSEYPTRSKWKRKVWKLKVHLWPSLKSHMISLQSYSIGQKWLMGPTHILRERSIREHECTRRYGSLCVYVCLWGGVHFQRLVTTVDKWISDKDWYKHKQSNSIALTLNYCYNLEIILCIFNF